MVFKIVRIYKRPPSIFDRQTSYFQFLVADPFSDKILDPDDREIPSSIYPNLKQYPSDALRPEWYFNRLSVIETGQVDFVWQNDDYTKPEKDNLIIYELLSEIEMLRSRCDDG